MDAAFLRTIAAAPTDRLARLVYADWLDEQSGPHAASQSAFLRLTAELGADAAGEDDPRRGRLRELAAGLDADWLGVVSDPRVENCVTERSDLGREFGFRFEFVCDKRWDELRSTDAAGVRFCDGCNKNVHYCDTVDEAREHAWAGHCVTVDLRVRRRPGDLTPASMMLTGLIAPVDAPDLHPDDISAEPVAPPRGWWARRLRGRPGSA